MPGPDMESPVIEVVTEAVIDRVAVVRRGTALELALAGGERRVVRRIDLAPILGWPGANEPRFADAVLSARAVHITYTDGTSEAIERAHLLAPGSRQSRADLVIENIGCLITCDGEPDDLLGVMADAAVVCGGDRVLWVGPGAELSRSGYDLTGADRVDAGGRLVTPGLVDCHAHPLFAGDRAGEFERRAQGDSYLDIAAAGGGIGATLEPTRAASFDDHVALAAARMARALAHGTTTCEAKTGYDLTLEGELRLCEIACAVDALQPVDLMPTLLGAHALPPEYAGARDDYVRLVAEHMIPRAAERGLAHAADVYCDQGAFSLDETRRILMAARAAGMHLRAHVGQFADLGGAELIAELGGLSADHLENVSGAGISALAAHGVVAVMLPGACVQLRMTPPPVAALRQAGVPMAVATDLNPGTSLSESLPVQMWLATTHYGMTVTEAWLGVTRLAARALGRHDIGVLTPGALADIVIWQAGSPAEIPYHYGVNLVERVIKAGRVVAN